MKLENYYHYMNTPNLHFPSRLKNYLGKTGVFGKFFVPPLVFEDLSSQNDRSKRSLLTRQLYDAINVEPNVEQSTVDALADSMPDSVSSENSLHVVYFYQYFGTPKGSWSTRVYEIGKRWVDMGHKVTVVTSPYYKSDITASKFISRKKVDGIDLIIINASDSNKYNFFKRSVNAFVFALWSIYYSIKLDYDAVICSSGPLTIGLPGIATKILRKKEFVFEVRDLWPQGSIELGKLKNRILIKLAYWLEKKCYQYADLIVPCSVDMEKSIVSRYPGTATCVIPNASDSSFYVTPHENPRVYPEFLSGMDIILYAGSLGLMDDCMQIINAAKLLKKRPIAIVFAGDGAEKEILEREVKRFNLTNVYFTGLLPKTDIIKWFFLSKASIITFKNIPVLSTNSPNKMFDSFAAGVPIVQTTSGWIHELVEKERCGVNASAHNAKSLADAINWIIDHEEERQIMAQNALRLAKSEFNRDELAIKYMDAIEENLFQSRRK